MASQWQCTQCTCMNGANVTECAACLHPKHVSEEKKEEYISLEEMDDLLDAIDKESRSTDPSNAGKNDLNWDEILRHMRNGDTNYIKTLISSREMDINTQNVSNGMTLLIYAVIIGNMDLVKAICNGGADVHMKDKSGNTALGTAIKYGRYKITELLYYQQLSGSLGNDLKRIATQIHRKTEEAKYWLDSTNDSSVTQFMIKTMTERAPFHADILFDAWYLETHRDENTNPLQSELFVAMMASFEQIIANTSDKTGWEWMKLYFVNSLIWYLPHPMNAKESDIMTKESDCDDDSEESDSDYDDTDDSDNNNYGIKASECIISPASAIDHVGIDESGSDNGDMETKLQQTLFYELLTRIRKESLHQSNLLLKPKIDTIKNVKANEWKELKTYNVMTKYSNNARQDACECLKPKYNEHDLSETKYRPSTHFSAKKHYDCNIYLNELIFRANLLNSRFQNDMKAITKEIGIEGVRYRAGPVKTLQRSQAKVENDYVHCDYPTAAKILDINRCALQFKDIESMMKYIHRFQQIIRKQNHCIVDVIRCKNGWSEYNEEYPNYTDIKLNVMVKINSNVKIIAEVQFLLDLMSSFKKKSHKLYSVERRFEMVYNFQKLKDTMSKFADCQTNSDVMRHLMKNGCVKELDLLCKLKGDAVPDYLSLIRSITMEQFGYKQDEGLHPFQKHQFNNIN